MFGYASELRSLTQVGRHVSLDYVHRIGTLQKVNVLVLSMILA